ncbi:type II toxin-antitoxin system VapC family toxin [Saccharothrix sp. NRRL B-16314]|uniref:type II toxin-antitoxin system VapC family toxin n=1 Tax=Saccharothrix sp. NRRL B-16314 TaxID=1463825 RepID=UPI000526EE23|nr:type II toxin-antitoxin system VapC family toxin [Saccharothrix sp. NRRL B-16314]
MIYLDTSALVKLVRREPGTAELAEWLNAEDQVGAQRVSSVLAEVELSRALRRSSPRALAGVPLVLSDMYLVEMTPMVRQTAASYSDPLLRSLDAIHLATAQVLAGGLHKFVSYDKRLLEAAASSGLPTAAPGSYDG